MFPRQRPRRLRRNEAIRKMVAETSIKPAHLVYPLFVAEGSPGKEPIASMRGADLIISYFAPEAARLMGAR